MDWYHLTKGFLGSSQSRGGEDDDEERSDSDDSPIGLPHKRRGGVIRRGGGGGGGRMRQERKEDNPPVIASKRGSSPEKSFRESLGINKGGEVQRVHANSSSTQPSDSDEDSTHRQGIRRPLPADEDHHSLQRGHWFICFDNLSSNISFCRIIDRKFIKTKETET